MVQKAMSYLDETPDMETKLQLINTLRQVTEGKIFVEVERARVTLYLAKIHENEGKISEAADILQELQVETFGSMEKREKTEFLLEQMRLCLANGDYVRTLIISRKIGLNFFKSEENHDLKLRFYELMIQYASHENNYLDISKHYLEVYHTPSVQADDAKKKQALEQALIYVMLSPYDNEQSDLIHRIMQDPYLEKSPQHKELGTSFTTIELIRWPSLQELYGKSLLSIDPFVRGTEQGAKRWDDLHSRVIEHNIRVIEKYYTRITLKRMTELLDLDLDQTEDVLAKLVVSKTIYAKIDRPSGIVNFQAPKDANTILNEWTHDINKLLSLVEKTNHLIAKEEMVHKIVVRK
jgi:26S proteasome regulatory subunit N5